MSTTQLKIIALIAMLIDHVGHFIPDTPEWFRWIGRIAMPIFIFAVVIGFQHTSNRKNYLIRLYMFSIGMSFLNLIINYIYRYYYSVEDLTNNFFAPLFVIVLLLTILEKKQPKFILLFIVWQIVSFFLCVVLTDLLEFPDMISNGARALFWGSILGNVVVVEGGPLFILMGVLLYLARNNKIKMVMIYGLISFLCFYGTYKWGHTFNDVADLLFPFASYQWMMIAAVPFILLYNNKKGMGLKYFFYIFYPVHIVILYLIGFYLQNHLRIEP